MVLEIVGTATIDAAEGMDVVVDDDTVVYETLVAVIGVDIIDCAVIITGVVIIDWVVIITELMLAPMEGPKPAVATQNNG